MTLLALSGTSLVVLLLGLTLLVGFGADWLARRFRVPDVLWLIGLGVAAGPLLHLLSPHELLGIAPILGTAALVLILFNAGIDLHVGLVRPLLGSAILFALATYAVSTLLVFLVADLVFVPGQLVLALLFAAALGPTSGAVIIPLANLLGVDLGLRSVLQLDGAIEDAVAIVTVTTLLTLVAPHASSLALTLTTSLLLPLPVGILLGLVAGLAWLPFLYEWQDRPFAALATLGFLFTIYAVAEALGGSGILAAIVFGAVLGNAGVVRRLTKRGRPFLISEDLRKVEGEVAFMLRAFFLFLVGMLVTIANPGLLPTIAIGALVVALYFARRTTFRAVTDPHQIPRSWAGPVAALYGRGLTSAVLLTVSLSVIPGVPRLFLPALLIIVGSNVVMTVALFVQPPSTAPAGLESVRRWAEVAPSFVALDIAEEPLRVRGDPDRPLGPSTSGPPSPPPSGPPPLPRARDPESEGNEGKGA